MEDPTREKDSFELLRPKFHRWMGIVGISLLGNLGCVFISYGTNPWIKVGPWGRPVIYIWGALSVVGFTLITGLLAGEWLLERYSDTRKP